VEAGNVATVGRLLAEGANPEARNPRGWTPLIIAANTGNVAIARLLIEKGANVNARTTSTNASTVLCFAAQKDDPDLLDVLVQHGAQINARGQNGLTALYVAVMRNNERSVKYLIAKGARLDQLAYMDARGHLYTALMVAAFNGNVRLTELLLNNGANLEKRNNFGNTALMEAALAPQPEQLKFMIEHGANVNARSPKGHTALTYAVESGRTENIKVLLAAGAVPHATIRFTGDPDEDGWDLVRLANLQGNPEAVQLILEAQKQTKSVPDKS
jgi:ankyrin repeat protein